MFKMIMQDKKNWSAFQMLFEERAIYVEGMFCGATCVTEEDEPC